jgi:hypothetical protein
MRRRKGWRSKDQSGVDLVFGVVKRGQPEAGPRGKKVEERLGQVEMDDRRR